MELGGEGCIHCHSAPPASAASRPSSIQPTNYLFICHLLRMDDAAPNSEWASFMDELREFFASRGEELKVPIFNKQEIDLEKLWHLVRSLNGSEEVCRDKKWAYVGRCFDPPRSMTNLSFHIKRIYEKCLLSYEKAHYPAGAMTRGMEHASPSKQRFGCSTDFFERQIHIPRKRRTSMGRRMRKLRKVEICTEASADADNSAQTPSWLRGSVGNIEPCESDETPASQITTPDWLASRESEEGQTSTPPAAYPYGSDEMDAAATLSEMCQLQDAKGNSRLPQHRRVSHHLSESGFVWQAPTNPGITTLRMVGSNQITTHPYDISGQQMDHIPQRQSTCEAKRGRAQDESHPPSVIQVAPLATSFTPPAPVLLSHSQDTSLTTRMKDIYEAKIAALKIQHFKEISELRRAAAESKQLLLEKQAQLKATQASADEARHCFQTLLSVVNSTDRH